MPKLIPLRQIFVMLALSAVFARISASSTDAPGSSQSRIPLAFVQKIPFIHVVIGATEADLMFDSGGMLGITLTDETIARSGTVHILDHKSKHGDAAGHIFEVADIIANNVSANGIPLSDAIKGNSHYDWGLNVSSENRQPPDELTRKRANGSIGLEAFSGKSMLLDYPHGQLRLFGESAFPFANEIGWKSLLLEYGKQGPQVIIMIGDRPLKMILDTGANTSILRPSALDEIKFPNLCRDLKLERNYCGHMNFSNPTSQAGDSIGNLGVELVEMKGVPFDGILGADFFESHLVFIDIANHRVWIKNLNAS